MTVAEQSAEGTTQKAVHTRALIIGTGFSGLGMAIALQKQGVDFVILEKADDVGGTWRDNTYPGAACDVPSHLYSFSFAPKPDWPHVFSYQPDILTYLKGVTDKYGLKRSIRFGQHVDRAHWDDSEYRWHVFTKSGEEYVAQFVISGAGALHIPSLPDIAGLGDFHGPVFHTAQWDHTVDLTGKRVAVIGTGASAIQVVPELVKIAGQVQLYQRTPAWIKPRINFAFPAPLKRAFRFVPGLRAALRDRHLLDSGCQGTRIGQASVDTQDRPADVHGEYAALCLRPEAEEEAHADLPGGLQANPHIGQLLSGRRRPQDRSDHRRNRAGDVRQHRHRRRHRTRSRRHSLRDWLPRHRLVHLPRHQGCRRRGHRRSVES